MKINSLTPDVLPCPHGIDRAIRRCMQCEDEQRPVAVVVAVHPPGPDGHGVNWLKGKRPKPGDLLYAAQTTNGSTMTTPQVPQDQADAYHEFGVRLTEYGLAMYRQQGPRAKFLSETLQTEHAALRSQLEAANKQIADLQGRLDAIEGQPTEAWLVKFAHYGFPQRVTCGHNAIADYRQIDQNATVTELIPRVAPL